MEDYSYGNSKIKVKKDYLQKSYSNPYFDRFKRGFNTKLYLKILLVIFLIYVFVYSDVFKIKTINVSGHDLISDQELINVSSGYIDKWSFFIIPKNVIFLNKSALKNNISDNFAFDSIEIKKGWQKIDIKVVEKVCYLIIKNSTGYYYGGLDGIIVKQLSEDEIIKRQEQLPVIAIDKQVNIGEKLFSKEKTDYILELDKKLMANGLKPKNYQDRGVVEISAVFEEGWSAYFDLNMDLNVSIENLKIILEKKVTDRKLLEYIDLRMGDKVYYK